MFEGSDGEDDKELIILEKKLDAFEKSTNSTVYPPFLAYSMSANEEVSNVFLFLNLFISIHRCVNILTKLISIV